MERLLDLMTASLLPGVAPRAARALSARGPLSAVLREPDAHADLLPPAARQALRTGVVRARAEEHCRRARQAGVNLVGWDDQDYPAWLRHIHDPPPVLWVRGTLAGVVGERSVAVVGARAASPQGRELARTMASDLAAAGLAIVSGLARGIDTAAHLGALDAAGRTVAVLGSGLDRLYPGENAAMAARIEERGAVVSEFPLGTGARPGHFPRRNRIIAGLSRAVVVVEAGERSGALVTARLAAEEGREVMAVPGHPSHPAAAGTNALLRDGATLVRGAADVAEEVGVVLAGGDEPADPVLRALARGVPQSVDELGQRVGLEPSALLGRLAVLEIEKRVRRLPGALFVRS